MAPAATSANPDLVAWLKQWRLEEARKLQTPAYVILHDATIEDLASKRPRTTQDLLSVTGIGQAKATRYGADILQALEAFRGGARAEAQEAKGPSPKEHTIQLLREGRTFPEIAEIRGRQLRSVIQYVATLVERGEIEFDPNWLDAAKRSQIEGVAIKVGLDRLNPIKQALPAEVTFEEILLAIAPLRYARRKTSSGEAMEETDEVVES